MFKDRSDSQLRQSRTTAAAGSTRRSRDLKQLHAHSEDATRLLKALANENRLMILCLLFEGPQSVSELNAVLPLSQSALSQHLAVLREEGLVSTTRQAQEIHYRIASPQARRIIETLHGIYCGSK
jgi:ArsR family transcriptional regulator, virulence genes transcriptional regulator